MSITFRRITAAVVIAGAATVCVAPVTAGASPAAACPLIALGNGSLKVDTNCLTSSLGTATTPTTAAAPAPTAPTVQTPTTLHLGNDGPDWTIQVEADDTTASTLPAANRKAADAGTTGSTAATGGTSSTGPAGVTGASGAAAAATGTDGVGSSSGSGHSGAVRSSATASDVAATPAAIAAAPVPAGTPAGSATAVESTPVSSGNGGSSWLTWTLAGLAMALAGGLVWRNSMVRSRSDVDGPARWYDRVIVS